MNEKMFSIVIRNRNESAALDNILSILHKIYDADIYETIIIDNNSTDDSIEVAKKHNCKILTITNFTYGRAINMGIAASESKYVLLLSSHAIPIGNSFFKNSLLAIQQSNKIAGIRFINSIDNYNRALKDNFQVTDPLTYGLNAACSIINKEVWQTFKFDEDLIASEDKYWSKTVISNGYQILDLNETYFYFIKRNRKSNLKRYKIETIFQCQMNNMPFPSVLKTIISFFKKVFVTNNVNYLKTIYYDFYTTKTKLEISRALNKSKTASNNPEAQ